MDEILGARGWEVGREESLTRVRADPLVPALAISSPVTRSLPDPADGWDVLRGQRVMGKFPLRRAALRRSPAHAPRPAFAAWRG